MSYCRWSSDCWKSDIYCYEAETGYMVHIAAKRVVSYIPPLNCTSPEALLKSYQEQMKHLEIAERKNIGLCHDGTTHSFDTPKETAEFLVYLKEQGYNVPYYAIYTLLEEANEKD